ncbi:MULTISPECIES: hypothetical protein [Pseudoalteromonas]|uniref:hypothetical protein n=1 Tax=Pseudoalteromonas TaxID=53246 RepID=UPI0015841FC1|nr:MULTISPECIES: hypothetical protein [Pseudoalteromonas]MDI4653602.1 hypothetical protein [Pseudoalteromonas shioyasakiensis]NUJ39364.1 hypothetical protein [Pseudoalteromonas sp. 0303]
MKFNKIQKAGLIAMFISSGLLTVISGLGLFLSLGSQEMEESKYLMFLIFGLIASAVSLFISSKVEN